MPASLARAIPVFAHGPLAGEGLAPPDGSAWTVLLGVGPEPAPWWLARQEKWPVASASWSLYDCNVCLTEDDQLILMFISDVNDGLVATKCSLAVLSWSLPVK